MAKKKSSFKSFSNLIKELRKTEKGKSILFLSFYFVFFLVIVIFIRVAASNPRLPIEYENTSNGLYTFDKIFAGNYNFIYTISIDGNTFTFNGMKDGNIESFKYNGIDYYYDGENYYTVDENNIWVIVDNPYIYTDFINFSRLGEVIVDATYISKTELADGKTLFNYLVSSNSMIRVLEGIETDIDEIPNSVVFTASGDNLHLNKLELDFTNYGKYKGICFNNFNITLEYFNFDNVEIVSPII